MYGEDWAGEGFEQLGRLASDAVTPVNCNLCDQEVAMERCLLLFSSEFPCWDGETLALAGEDPSALEKLCEERLLLRCGGGYSLSPCGVVCREALSEELCVPVEPLRGILQDERAARAALERNRLYQLLDRAFNTRWGVKEMTCGETFPVTPCLADDQFFSLKNGTLEVLWTESPFVQSFLKEFPHWGVAARGLPAPGGEALEKWVLNCGAPRGTVTFDVVLRSRYDFTLYKKHPPLASDLFRFQNADRVFCVKAGSDAEALLPIIGRFHVFLMGQRRVYVPGYADIDSEEQENWTLLNLVTDREDQLAELTEKLRSWGQGLIDPARPLFITGSSVERLRSQKETKDTLYDWFCEETVKILRPDGGDDGE